MMAITTSNSTSVKPAPARREEKIADLTVTPCDLDRIADIITP
jgi:hypothetical protein